MHSSVSRPLERILTDASEGEDDDRRPRKIIPSEHRSSSTMGDYRALSSLVLCFSILSCAYGTVLEENWVENGICESNTYSHTFVHSLPDGTSTSLSDFSAVVQRQ